MVLRCYSHTCIWRVYDVLLKNTKLYEVRCVELFHTSSVYPEAKHSACIFHLKRNIRTYFKDKHLGYLVGKAARAYKLSQFYSAFNEIKTINVTRKHNLCSRCKGSGHNKATFKMKPAMVVA
ncbi:hypothetical protein HID58_074523 [Brassica napus]|uniref:Protein FAR1-RELATED SEQUENCE n=1 Tax=Brassica napus TaxID=3708 RepID=A0ABQ7YGZ8_BRANA|nr:hypothetical protein HID58_074523 [Brassica napus]